MEKGDATHRAVELIEAAVGAEGFEEFSSGILPFLAELTRDSIRMPHPEGWG